MGSHRRVIVVGAGIAGLAAAYRCVREAEARSLPLALRVLDAARRPGGVIATWERDGFLLEAGPDCFLTEKPAGLRLCRELGLEAELIGTNPAQRRSFIAWRGELHPIPDGFQLLAPANLPALLRSPLLTWRGKLRAALEPFAFPPPEEDESVGDFVRRRLGREVLERLAQPLVAGIYGADPDRLSLRATLPRFHRMEREHGSLLRALARSRRHAGVSGARYGLFASFRRGMQTLVDALAARLPADALRLETRVRALEWHSASAVWHVVTESGREEADAVLLALPGPVTAQLLAPVAPAIGRLVASVPYASAATIQLAYRREAIPHPLAGFGFVVPAIERRTVLGCTFSHVKFPGRAPEGYALLRGFVGDGADAHDDDRLLAAVAADLAHYLGIASPPLWAEIVRHPRAMPQYPVGHLARMEALHRELAVWPTLALAGNAYAGVGIPDCIESGERAAERLVAALARTDRTSRSAALPHAI